MGEFWQWAGLIATAALILGPWIHLEWTKYRRIREMVRRECERLERGEEAPDG